MRASDPVIDHAQLIAQARLEYEKVQDAALAESPLGAMSSWVAGTAPPTAEALRSAGLTSAGLDEETNNRLRLARMAFTRHWGFSIPCREAVDVLRTISPLLEVGAGSGYWSAILKGAGADVIATDAAPRGANPHGFETSGHFNVAQMAALEAIQAYPTRAVFCSWPTEGGAWAAEAFSAIRPGNYLAVVCDDRGGVTATEDLYDLLERDFELSRVVDIPQFPKVNDRLWIYRRQVRGE